MLVQNQGPYQLIFPLSSGQLGCPIFNHSAFVIDFLAPFMSLDDGAEAHSDSGYLIGRLAE